MATTKRLFVFMTCVLSGLGVIVTLIALVTEQWVVTDSARWIDASHLEPNTIKYGLFQGTFHQLFPSPATLQLTMTCLVSKNACALLCAANSDGRYSLLKKLVEGEYPEQDDANCPRITVNRRYLNNNFFFNKFYESPINKEPRKFINYGVWISTVVFVLISMLFGVVASALALYNTVYNPIKVYLGVFGLYATNAIALFAIIMVMALWGVMHILITYHNVAIYYTLVGKISTDKIANLGFSYWINFIPIICYAANIVLLYVRQYLISKDPIQKIIQRDETADPGILLY